MLVDLFRYTLPDELRHNPKYYWTYKSKIEDDKYARLNYFLISEELNRFVKLAS